MGDARELALENTISRKNDQLLKQSQRIEELEGALRSVKSTLNGIQEPEFSGYGCDSAIDEIDKALDKE